jgi:threonine dehydratase
VVTVEEEYIAASIQIMLERKKILSEGAGAAPLAALLNGSIRTKPGERIVLLVSGGNVDIPLLGRIIQQGLIKNGRVMRIRLSLNDRPGTLATLLNQVAALQANILHIHHDRGTERSNIDETQVELELETRNADHIREIGAVLKAAGYKMAHLSCRRC